MGQGVPGTQERHFVGLVLVALERRWNYGVKVDPCIHMCAIYVSMREREPCGSGLVVSVSQTS